MGAYDVRSGRMASKQGKKPSLRWRAAQLILAGSRNQAFLNRKWIPIALKAVPSRLRRRFALGLLSLSPHYFIYQWEKYPDPWSRLRVLEAEFQRNCRSRQEIADQLLTPRLSPSASALDFGCGPGFLAGIVNQQVDTLVALDVSTGVLACAEVLNPGPAYGLVKGDTLPSPSESVDTIYSMAVFQHIDPADWPSYFDEFLRVLRPGGFGICHFVLNDAAPTEYQQPRGLRGFYSLRFQESSSETVRSQLTSAGFVDIDISPVAATATVTDDIGDQHVAIFYKPSRA